MCIRDRRDRERERERERERRRRKEGKKSRSEATNAQVDFVAANVTLSVLSTRGSFVTANVHFAALQKALYAGATVGF